MRHQYDLMLVVLYRQRRERLQSDMMRKCMPLLCNQPLLGSVTLRLKYIDNVHLFLTELQGL